MVVCAIGNKKPPAETGAGEQSEDTAAEAASPGVKFGALFVAAGAVHAGDRDVVEAEIDAKNRAVVDDVVHQEAASHGRAGHGEDYAVAAAECPLVAHR